MHSVSGRTQILPLIGHPVVQVKSPERFNSHFRRHGIDTVIFPLDLEAKDVAPFLANLRGWKNCVGCSVTVPHKQRAFAVMDRLTARARNAGAVNIVRRDQEGQLHGDMTDGLAMIGAITAQGHALSGRRVLVVGAGGGAGSAIAWALCEAGIAGLTVLEPDAMRRTGLLEGLARAFPALEITATLSEHAAIDMVVNASPVGMGDDGSLPVDPALFGPGTIFADVVTQPVETPMLARARQLGMKVVTGLDMIDWQLPFQMSHLGYATGVDA